MKKLICIFGMASVLFSADAQELLKLTGSEKVLNVQNLVGNPDGSVSYISEGKKKITVPGKAYDYAWVPMPKEIAEADLILNSKDFPKAEKLYSAAYNKYKLLGWDVYCTMKRAQILAEENRLSDALAFLEPLQSFQALNPEVQKHVMEAQIYYSRLLIQSGDLKKAAAYTENMLKSPDDNTVFHGFLNQGDLAVLDHRKKKAVRCYLQAVFLFTTHPDRPVVLYKAANLLKEMKDDRWKNLAEMLKKKYPDSEYSKKI